MHYVTGVDADKNREEEVPERSEFFDVMEASTHDATGVDAELTADELQSFSFNGD